MINFFNLIFYYKLLELKYRLRNNWIKLLIKAIILLNIVLLSYFPTTFTDLFENFSTNEILLLPYLIFIFIEFFPKIKPSSSLNFDMEPLNKLSTLTINSILNFLRFNTLIILVLILVIIKCFSQFVLFETALIHAFYLFGVSVFIFSAKDYGSREMLISLVFFVLFIVVYIIGSTNQTSLFVFFSIMSIFFYLKSKRLGSKNRTFFNFYKGLNNYPELLFLFKNEKSRKDLIMLFTIDLIIISTFNFINFEFSRKILFFLLITPISVFSNYSIISFNLNHQLFANLKSSPVSLFLLFTFFTRINLFPTIISLLVSLFFVLIYSENISFHLNYSILTYSYFFITSFLFSLYNLRFFSLHNLIDKKVLNRIRLIFISISVPIGFYFLNIYLAFISIFILILLCSLVVYNFYRSTSENLKIS